MPQKYDSSKRKTRRSPKDWAALVDAWKNSQQSQREFCDQRDLCYRRFNQWKNRLSKLSEHNGNEDLRAFLPVQLHDDAPPANKGNTDVLITLPNKIKLSLNQDSDIAFAVTLAKQLATLPC